MHVRPPLTHRRRLNDTSSLSSAFFAPLCLPSVSPRRLAVTTSRMQVAGTAPSTESCQSPCVWRSIKAWSRYAVLVLHKHCSGLCWLSTGVQHCEPSLAESSPVRGRGRPGVVGVVCKSEEVRSSEAESCPPSPRAAFMSTNRIRSRRVRSRLELLSDDNHVLIMSLPHRLP